jgi:alpha-mannosidase
MQKHPDLTRGRIERFLEETLRPALWHTEIPLEAAVHHPQGGPRDYRHLEIHPEQAVSFDYQSVAPGYVWGPVWSDAWFRFRATVPAEWAGKSIVARIDTGTESIVWDGANPLQGLDWQHGEILLLEEAQGGDPITLYVQATGMNPNVSVHGRPQKPSPSPFTFRHAFLSVYDRALIGLYFDMRVAFEVMQEQPQDSPRYGQLLFILNDLVGLLSPHFTVDRATGAVRFGDGARGRIPEAQERLAAVYRRPASASAHEVSAIGHAHIDTAWLWPLERTQYKCLHTFATATRLMDQYPEYKFICSQAAQYEWVSQMAPALYERIKEKIRAWQWEVTGSMWVEADCNLSGGESLIRQIVLAKNFFQDEFGIETKDLWLPDVFGYAAALPQILKKARIDYFLTQKISWNQFNKFPHHTFLWQGIDGTRIFTHFPPADTYNAAMTPKELAYNVRNFREHDRANRSLYVYGFGDGGGGPTVPMLEYARRLDTIEGMPKVTLEKAADFFQKAVEDAKDLPLWVGELYLELHRGTYTTQARNKRGNRKSEFLLRDAEFLSAVQPSGIANYPRETLDRAWKTVLLNQFHDIIPGSSVQEVYRDSATDYAQVAETLQSVIASGLQGLAQKITTLGMKRPVLVVSNLSHFANEAVEIPLKEGEKPVAAVGPEGEMVPVQILTKPDGARTALFVPKNLPLHGYAVWDLGATTVAPDDLETVTASPTHLENDSLRVEFDAETGLITRLYDKDSEREVLYATQDEAGALRVADCANQFQLFEDRPLFWDAWDIDLFYQETGETLTALTSAEVVENGPVRAAIRFVRVFGNSTLTQTVRLAAGSARLDFVTEVDWQETNRMLKVAFPVAIHSARASYEIQYGHVERPTHFNTSWDMARFEVCAQKWVDLSEGDYGVALLNDCKYGHDVRDHVLRMTLLRAPLAPDPEADLGHHTFTYALLPHGNDVRDGEVIENAYALNAPPLACSITGNQTGSLPATRSFFEVDNAGIFIEAIKKAEQEEALIVRMYEGHNTRGTVTLTTTLSARRAYLTNLMESNLEELALRNGAVTLPVLPFEIITVKFVL